jgi:hypothetical protein
MARPCGFHERAEAAHPSGDPGAGAEGRPPAGIRAISHWTIRGVAEGWLEPARAQAINAACRILVALGEDAPEAADANRLAVLRGKIMHGMAPETGAEWEMVEALFGAGAVAQVRSWRSLKHDPVDRRDPLRLRHLGHGEGDVPALGEHQDG